MTIYKQQINNLFFENLKNIEKYKINEYASLDKSENRQAPNK